LTAKIARPKGTANQEGRIIKLNIAKMGVVFAVKPLRENQQIEFSSSVKAVKRSRNTLMKFDKNSAYQLLMFT
jgi:hypothetical protein